MEIIIQPTAQDASNVAASIIAKLISEKPNAVLGLATGSTPLPLYQRLIELKLDWSQVITFNLDEYIGLPRDHEQTYHTFMWENLFKHTNINPANGNIPDGNAADIPKFCAEYEALILAKGGIDIQVLGIGTDGHIGFNEPTSSFASRTRIKTLTEQTRKDNARFFDNNLDEVPIHCITMGIGTIMDARQNILLAFGDNKAPIIAETVEGPLQAINPASILQMHPNAKFCIDQKAAALLKRKDYYNWVYSNKPEWQRY
ncbi:MAG: glucosamine-6-phosphate deaminase [Akkermansiaceae bacterium]